jgi:hypothetical protein
MVLGHLVFKEDHLAVKGGRNPGPRQQAAKLDPSTGGSGSSFDRWRPVGKGAGASTPDLPCLALTGA